MANNGSYLLVHGNNYSGNPIIQQFSTSGSTSSIYMSNFPGLGSTRYDTAWFSGGIWIARDNADSPILAFNTSGMMVGCVEGATVSAAAGLTVDSSGYLWASNPDDDTIYQLDVSTGIEEGSSAPVNRGITVDRNPFASSVIITAEGFSSDASIEVFDLTGRRVRADRFSGVYTWNAVNMPSGVYFAVVSDEAGSSVARFTKVR
ncbi:MAG: T9SS type A sorting domain-containing protein [Candidatus Fermentibacteraceae bacterium]|nr:T9SS type A sorting domain-containing protein [Candidatus Fermentibacteraceae bacterium]